MITQKRLREVLRYNPCTGQFHWRISRQRIWPGQQAGWKKKDGYVQVGVDGETYYAHVLAWLYIYGKWPNEIDHLDENKSSNGILNLLNVSHSDNMRRHYSNRRETMEVD